MYRVVFSVPVIVILRVCTLSGEQRASKAGAHIGTNANLGSRMVSEDCHFDVAFVPCPILP
jgi:hypothetical protein